MCIVLHWGSQTIWIPSTWPEFAEEKKEVAFREACDIGGAARTSILMLEKMMKLRRNQRVKLMHF